MLQTRRSILLFYYCIFMTVSSLHAADEPFDLAAITKKVRETYQSMDSYSSKGEIITEMDMSKVDPSKLPGMPPNGEMKDSPLMKSMFQDKQTLKHEFELYLSRSGDYRIEWDQDINAFIKMHGVAWSKDGKYKLMISSPMMQQPVMEQKDKTMALAAATGVSGGAAHTIPSIFYDIENELLQSLQDLKKAEDETVDGKECFVLSGSVMGQTMTVWIGKKSFLIVQRKQIIGENSMIGNMKDEDIKAGLEATNQEVTPESIENFKSQMKNMAAVSAQMKGTIIEKHRDIQVNPELKPEDFEPEL